MKRKHQAELVDNLRLAQQLQQTVQELNGELAEKDRTIKQLKNNLSLMEDRVAEMAKQRDNWRTEADFFKTSEYASISELRNNMENTDDYEFQVRDFKDKIFAFLINERNKGVDKTRVDFYKSIINLLMFASDSEKESKFDLKTLVSYFTNEGKQHFGQGYAFHNFNKDEANISKLDAEFEEGFNKSVEKHNKSETRIASSNNDFIRMHSPESTNLLGSNDGTCLTEIGSMVSRKIKKRKKKKTKVLEGKVQELTDAIEKQKIEVKALQKRLRDNSLSTPRGKAAIQNLTSFERSSQIRTTRRSKSPLPIISFPPKSPPILPQPQFDESLLQYTHLLSKMMEENLEERRTIRKSANS